MEILNIEVTEEGKCGNCGEIMDWKLQLKNKESDEESAESITVLKFEDFVKHARV